MSVAPPPDHGPQFSIGAAIGKACAWLFGSIVSTIVVGIVVLPISVIAGVAGGPRWMGIVLGALCLIHTLAVASDDDDNDQPHGGSRSDLGELPTTPRQAEQWPNGQPATPPYRHPQEGGDFVG